MRVFKVIRDETPLYPDPDISSEPEASVASDELIYVSHALGDWLKSELRYDAGTRLSGWIKSGNTEFFAEAEQGEVELFDEPIGENSETVSGLIVRAGPTVGTWHKVEVLDAEGNSVVGWMEGNGPEGPAVPESDDIPPSPAPSRLKLGVNEVYREALLAAEERTKIDAAALAALIDAEASKIKSGPNKGQWNRRAENSGSGAAGLTQFLRSTWTDWVKRKGTLLHERARELGYLTASGNIRSGKTKAVLDLRFDPELSIVSAAEYGVKNLKYLAKKGLIPANATDDQKARYMYLAHHEGAGGATSFLNNSKVYTASNLRGQVGSRAPALIAAAGGDANKAYRDWLSGYVDQHIQPDKFRMAGASRTHIPLPRPDNEGISLADITGEYRYALKSFPSQPLPVSAIGGDKDLAKAIQEELTLAGYLEPPADGLWGDVSNWALSEFCKSNHLSLDGGFTKEIATALLDPAAGLGPIQSTNNWFDKVIAYMQKMDYFICRHPDAQNIVYVEGMNVDGSLNDDVRNRFNDVRIAFSLNNQGVPKFEVWDGTTEPGMFWTYNPMNKKGAARIAFNQYKAWRVGIHRPRPGAAGHEALQQVAKLSVYRDFDKNFIRTNDLLDTGLFGINQHWGYDAPKDDLGRTSAGCLVGRTTTGHKQFMKRIKTDARYLARESYKFVTAIIPGDKL